jgi:hypothetical protein
MRTPITVSLALLCALPLVACDTSSDSAALRAAKGTRQAVNNTTTAINQAQDAASKAADEVGKRPTAPTTPSAPAKPNPASDPNSTPVPPRGG